MSLRRIDLRTFLIIFGIACAGAIWAVFQRGTTVPPYSAGQIPALVWVVFATPLALFIGWSLARPQERWLAAFVCFCIYFFSPFVAARYESCVVVNGTFNLVSCFTETQRAQELAGPMGHRIYFEAIVVIHLCAALVVALQRALTQHTIRTDEPHAVGEPA
ncbi:MAG TPA: hypothetical protein PKA05_00350 [Roseiflexaceae bacterium]|nr:hypothetical protein [Roseiflexaceae bacterium]HMP38806.1 hypothetical protein [Roseiflexaceae bacterium]